MVDIIIYSFLYLFYKIYYITNFNKLITGILLGKKDLKQLQQVIIETQ